MAYNPNEGQAAAQQDIYDKQSQLAGILGNGQSSHAAQKAAGEMMALNRYTGGRTDTQRHFDEGTYGGSAAKYDASGNLIQASSADQEADYYRRQAEAAQMRSSAAIDEREQRRDYGGFQQQMGYSDQERARQGNAYNQQQASTNMYRDMATGAGPSLATALMGQGMNNIRAQQTSAAASARGPAGLAMAQQQAAGNMAAQGQQLNAQLGQMRAQEQLGAMQGYAQGTQSLSSAAGQMRAQDQSGAGLYNQARGMSAQNAQAQAQLRQNQNALNDARTAQYEQGRMGVYNANMQGGFNRRAADLNSANFARQGDQADDQRTSQMIGAGAATAAMMFSDVRAKTDITPIDSSRAAGAQALANSLSGKGSLASSFGALGGSLGAQMRAGNAGPMPTVSDATANQAWDASQSAREPGPSYFDPTSMSGTAAPITYMQGPRSDERSKQKIASLSDALMRSQAAMYNSPAAVGGPSPMAAQADMLAASQAAMYGAPSPIQETLRTTQPYAFNYKPGYGEDPGQRHVGIMAQDLEKTPAGSTLVKEGPKGKMIDGKQAVGFNLAAAADLQKQIDALKAERMAQSQMAMYSAPVAVRGQ